MSKYELLQWKFTACEYNIEGSNGFHTFSMSEGLTSQDNAELRNKAGTYTPPDNLPFTPTPDEIERLFPIAFSSFPLSSGKQAVVQTVYVGRSYGETDKRWGNFFSHALVFPQKSCPFHTIQLFDSSLFNSGLTEEELQIKTTPSPLPPIGLDIGLLRDFSKELPEFFRIDPMRHKALIPILNAVRKREQSGKPLILRDTHENIPLWIAAIQYAFPLRLSNEITFTTYVHSLDKCFHVTTSTADDNSPRVYSPGTKSTYHVFDFPNRDIPEVPANFSFFTAEIKSTESPYPGENMQAIHGFMQNLRFEVPGDSLDESVLLYKCLKSGLVPENQKHLQMVLDFCFQQDVTIKRRFVSGVFQNCRVYDAPTLNTLLPKLYAILYESKLNDLWRSFCEFFVRQFVINARPLTSSYCFHHFVTIDNFLMKYKEVGNMLAKHVRHLVDQTNEKRKYAFLYYSLFLCLSNEGPHAAFRQISSVFRLKKNESDAFFDVTVEIAVSKAVHAEIHEQIYDLYAERHSGELENKHAIVKGYASKLARYGLAELKNGMKIQPQGLAFVKYVLELSDKKRKSHLFKIFATEVNGLFAFDGTPRQNIDSQKNVYKTLKIQLELNRSENKCLRNKLIKYRNFMERRLDETKAVCTTLRFIVFVFLLVILSVTLVLEFCFWDNIKTLIESFFMKPPVPPST